LSIVPEKLIVAHMVTKLTEIHTTLSCPPLEKPTTGPYPESAETNPQPPPYSFKILSNFRPFPVHQAVIKIRKVGRIV
jgi:hypothetical protein